MVVTIPLSKRPMYQGFFGALFGVASVAGFVNTILNIHMAKAYSSTGRCSVEHLQPTYPGGGVSTSTYRLVE